MTIDKNKLKQIASLKVFVQLDKDAPTREMNGIQPDGSYHIIISPLFDSAAIMAMHADPENGEETIFAHELGHWVEELLHDPATTPLARLASSVLSEEKAWTIARAIAPDKINEDLASKALATYELDDKKIPTDAKKLEQTIKRIEGDFQRKN